MSIPENSIVCVYDFSNYHSMQQYDLISCASIKASVLVLIQQHTIGSAHS
jgi:hypothetical protein